MCWNKLNKLSKLEHDIKTKLESLKADRLELIRTLRQKYQGEFSLHQPRMWTPKSKKHNIIHSPTLRKVKQLFVPSSQSDLTGSTTISDSQASCSKKTHEQEEKKEKRAKIQLFSPSKIKVVFRGKKESVKSKVIPAGVYQDIIRGMTRGESHQRESHQRVSQLLYNSSLKENILNSVLKDLKKELSKLSSTKTGSCLRRTSSDDLATVNFETWNLEFQLFSPVLFKIISGVFDDQKSVAVAMISAIIQKQKNMHMSAFHHAVSQVLDNGGATDECINLLNKLGLCVSSSAAAKKKTDFIARQTDHNIQKLVISEKIALEQNTDSLPAVLQGFIYN